LGVALKGADVLYQERKDGEERFKKQGGRACIKEY
jgi:hypothetical protein